MGGQESRARQKETNFNVKILLKVEKRQLGQIKLTFCCQCEEKIGVRGALWEENNKSSIIIMLFDFTVKLCGPLRKLTTSKRKTGDLFMQQKKGKPSFCDLLCCLALIN